MLPSLASPLPQPARLRASRNPGPGTRPAPGEPRLQRPPGRRPGYPRALTRKRETAIIVVLAMRLQETRAVLPLAGVPIAEPEARRGAGSAWLSGSWNQRLLLPSAASTAAFPAGSPSTSNIPYALRQQGSRAQEGGGDDGSGVAQHLPSGAAAPAGRGSGGCNPRLPVLSSDNGCGELGRRAGSERAKKQLPIAKPPATANLPPPLTRQAGEGLSRWPPGVGTHVVAPKGRGIGPL